MIVGIVVGVSVGWSKKTGEGSLVSTLVGLSVMSVHNQRETRNTRRKIQSTFTTAAGIVIVVSETKLAPRTAIPVPTVAAAAAATVTIDASNRLLDLSKTLDPHRIGIHCKGVACSCTCACVWISSSSASIVDIIV
jgi:hypothetical protein